MKRPEEVKRQILSEWLQKAEADFHLAEHLVSEKTHFFSAIAFHCQQAAEKYLKAFLVWFEVDFPKTHDLEQLLGLVGILNRSLAVQLQDVIVLTPYGVELRYPGDRPAVTEKESRQALELARQVRQAVLSQLPVNLV